MWSKLVLDTLKEENPDLYRELLIKKTLEEYIKGQAAIMRDAVKALSPRGDPMSTSMAHEIVIAELREEIRRGTDEHNEEISMVDARDFLRAFYYGSSEHSSIT